METLEAPGFFWTVLAFLALIGPLVFVHELGHYLAARRLGVKADVFSIGFGRRLFGWTDRRGTEWKVCALPLGGYVQFAGDRDAVSQPDAAWRDLPPEERDHTFPGQPVWKRAIIVAAGPFTNFAFAILLLAGFAWVSGQVTTPPVVGAVVPGSAAQSAGLAEGDRIRSIDGQNITMFTDMVMIVAHQAGEPLAVEFDRGGVTRNALLTPRVVRETDRFGNITERGVLGIQAANPVIEPVSLAEAPLVGFRQTVQITRQMAEVVGQLLLGKRSLDDMGGPLKIAKVSGEAAAIGFAAFVWLAALISINLGFINLLPFPTLDGGHLLFYAYEAVRRKPAPVKAQEWAFRFGFAGIIAFMVAVTINDLSSFGLWQTIARLIG